MGSKILLYASVFGGDITLKSSSGNSDGNEVTVKANTKWKAETSASWLHLQDQTDFTYGESIITYTYDKYDDEVLLSKRSAIVRLVTPQGVILNSFFIDQRGRVGGLRMTSDIAGQDVQKDITYDNASQQLKFYVYNPAPEEAWELAFAESDVDDWFSLNITEGSATTEVTLNINANTLSTVRRCTIIVKPKTSGKPGDILTVYQYMDFSKTYLPSITGGAGDWNANMKFQKIELDLTSTDYTGHKDTSTSFTSAADLNMRYSGSGLFTRNASYYIFNTDEELTGPLDSGGNEFSMLGEDRESTVDSDDFSRDDNAYAHYGLDGYSPHDKKDQSGAPIRFREGRTSMYSEDILHHTMTSSTTPSFTSSVPLVPDDFKDDSVWTIRNNPSTGETEKVDYKGTGICSVTLHNIYGAGVDSNDNSPMLKQDKIFEGYKTIDGKTVLGDELIPSGTFKPQNYFVEETDTELNRSIRLIRMSSNNITGNQNYREYIGLQKIGKNPITIKVKIIGVKEGSQIIEDENTSRTYVIPSYSYPIESVGRFKDGGKTIPNNTIHSLGLKGNRKAIRWSDEWGQMFFNIKYLDNIEGTSSPSTSIKVGWKFNVSANTKWKRAVAIFKIILYVAVAVAALVLAFVGNPASIWVAIWAVSSIMLLYFEIYELARGWARNKQNSQWQEHNWYAVIGIREIGQLWGKIHMGIWAWQLAAAIIDGKSHVLWGKHYSTLIGRENLFRASGRSSGFWGPFFAILQVAASTAAIVKIISTWPEYKDPEPNYKYCSAILNEVWIAD